MANPALALFDDEPMPPRARPGRLALFAVAANDNAPSSHRNALSKEQRMTGKVARTTDPLGEPTVTTYDAVDRPVFVTDAAGHVGGKTYDLAGEDLSETSGVGTPLLQTDAAFTYGADGEKLTVTDANSNLTQLAYDGFNRLLIALAAGGEASQIYTCDSYGANTNPASDTASGPNSYLYRYTGQRLDFTTGLYDYKARDYSPSVGRFIQPDPAGLDQGPNLYAYVGNSPVNAGDPDGMCNTHSGCYGDSGAVETGLPAPGGSDTSVVSGAVPGSGTELSGAAGSPGGGEITAHGVGQIKQDVNDQVIDAQSDLTAKNILDGSFEIALNSLEKLSVKAALSVSGSDARLDKTLRGMFGSSYSTTQINELKDKILTAITPVEIGTVKGIQEGPPVNITSQQKKVIDRVIARIPSDALGTRAKASYQSALANGQIIVKR